MQPSAQRILAGTVSDVRHAWRSLLATDLAYKVLAVVVLSPLVGGLFQVCLQFSGREVLADEDILRFLLSPLGWATTILVGALAIGIIALEQAALMTIIGAGWSGQRVSVRVALLHTASRAVAIVSVMARVIALVLIVAIPFLSVALLIYRLLLTQYDINYYLQERPPSFLLAVALGAGLVATLLFILLPLLASRVFAMPLVLFEQMSGKQALRTSCQRAQGQRWSLAGWLALWGVANAILSAVLTSLVAYIGMSLVGMFQSQFRLLIVAVGGVLIGWVVTNFISSLIGNVSFAALLSNVYRTCGSGEALGRMSIAASASARGQMILRLRRSVLVIGSLLAVMAGAIAGLGFLQSVRVDEDATVMAHRGASSVAPENTLAAVQAAIDASADFVEIDVQEAADGVVIVAHDSDLKKVGGDGKKVWEATASELRQTDIGSWFAPEFSDQRVPTLEEVLDLCRGKIKVNIELKYYGHNQRLESRVIELVKSKGMESDVVMMSLKSELIRRVKELEPKWQVGLLTATAVGRLAKVRADFLAVNASLATRSFVTAVHNEGKVIYVWTVNDPVQMSSMIGRGVDGIITDDPALLRKVIGQRQKLTTVEKLLLEVAELLRAAPEISLTADDA